MCLSCICLLASLTHVNLCHCFSSSWYQGLVATSACGSSWTFLFTFFQYLRIDRIIGGGQAISKLLLYRPPAWRLLLRLCVCERECVYVCFCSQLSHLISQPSQHTHTHTSAMRGSAYGGASNEKCNRQCACTILYRCGHRDNVEMFGACNSYHPNQLQASKNKPTRNWEHTPSLFGAAQNLSASRNILFTYFQVCVIGMASSQKGKMCPFSCYVKQRTCLLWVQNY